MTVPRHPQEPAAPPVSDPAISVAKSKMGQPANDTLAAIRSFVQRAKALLDTQWQLCQSAAQQARILTDQQAQTELRSKPISELRDFAPWRTWLRHTRSGSRPFRGSDNEQRNRLPSPLNSCGHRYVRKRGSASIPIAPRLRRPSCWPHSPLFHSRTACTSHWRSRFASSRRRRIRCRSL